MEEHKDSKNVSTLCTPIVTHPFRCLVGPTSYVSLTVGGQYIPLTRLGMSKILFPKINMSYSLVGPRRIQDYKRSWDTHSY